MSEYGWYYEEGHVQDTDGDLWNLIDSAVREAVEDARLDALRVGPMVDHKPSDFLDDDDIFNLVADDDERLTAERICECIDAQVYDLVTDGHARLINDELANMQFDPTMPAPVRAWADANIELEPTRSCDGRYPMPIAYADGKWRFGVEGQCSDAVITYSTEPSPETGHEGWCWLVPDISMGEAKTLKEAMRAAEEALSKHYVRRVGAHHGRLEQGDAMRLTLQCNTCNFTAYSEPGRFEPGELCGVSTNDDGPACPGSLLDITPLNQPEQARLARIQEQSRKLSLEECVYWLVVVGKTQLAEVVATRQWHHLQTSLQHYREIYRERCFGDGEVIPPKARREWAFIAFVLSQAILAIEDDWSLLGVRR